MLCSASMRAYKFLDAQFGLKSLQEQRLKISTLDDLNDPFELLPYEMTDRNRRSALRASSVRSDQKPRHVVFQCRLERSRETWAHDSDKHKGVCLGFEIPDEKCKKVNYVANRLPFPAKLAIATPKHYSLPST